MKLRIPVFVKITAPLLIIIVVSIGLSGYRVYQASTERWQAEVDRRLERVATLVAASIKTDDLLAVRAPIDINGETYARLAAFLEQNAVAGNIGWIGTYYRKGDFMYYWVDVDSTGVGYPFFYPTAAHFAAFEDRQVHRVRYTDEFGSYYGFVAPIVLGEGTAAQVIGIVEVAVSAESSQLLEQRTLAQVAPILAVGVLIALSCSMLVMALVFSRPLSRLQRGAQALVEGRFGYTIPWSANDEMGDLAASFNQMSMELKRLYGELQAYNLELEARVKARTAELQTERNRLDTILQNIAEGLVVTDMRGAIVLNNPAFAHIVGRPSEAVRGGMLREVLASPELNALVMSCLAAPEQVYSLNLNWTPGSEFKPRVYKAVVGALVARSATESAASASVVGAVTVLHDITHETEVDQMKTDFISMVSHELRTPLTSVLGFAKLIHKTFEKHLAPLVAESDERSQRALQRVSDNLNIIISEAERLTRLINDVLDIAKIEAGKIEWHIEEVTIHEIVQSAAVATSALAAAKHLRVEMAFEPDLPVIRADRDRIIQVVTNLISNAIKFTDVGAIQMQARAVTLDAEGRLMPDLGFASLMHGLPSGSWLAVSVHDSGIGIAPENLEKVFEKFKQVGEMMTNRPKGTGLGLTISKEIVEHHGGRIWVESVLGQGSTFTFVLPVAAPLPLAAQPQEAPRVREPEQVPVRPRRILVVDDEANIRELLSQELTEAGYRVLLAADGVAGLALARSELPDLIVMDLMMPGISGFDVISALRSDASTVNIPVLILSVFEDREKGYRLGADAYLTKPLNAAEVLATIERLLSRAARGEGHKKVLVIDEDASAVETMTRVFREKGYEVVGASSGVEGITKALSEQPHFIILDAMISRMNDYEILRTLKCTRETQSACIIVMAVRESSEEMQEVLRRGADFCGLPDDLGHLMERVEQVE